jgi:predicted dehydrogenase
VACVDTQLARAQAVAQRLDIKAFQNIQDALEWSQFDVAVVATPSGDHAEQALAFLNHKKHVLVEKPMALKLSDASAMIAAAERNGVLLGVVKQNRFNSPVSVVRQAFDSGRFGRVFLGTVRVRWCRQQSYYDNDAWRGKWLSDGGVFANQAIHHIDMLSWFMGPAKSVFAKTKQYLANIECEDTGAALIQFESGAMGIVEATTATRPSDMEGSFSLLGDNGSAEISGYALNRIRFFNFNQRIADDVDVITNHTESATNVYGAGHAMVYENFVSALNGEGSLLVTGEEAMKSLKLLHAMYLSAEENREVQLSEMPVSGLGVGLKESQPKTTASTTIKNLQIV